MPASIPFANHGGVNNWRAVGDRTVYFEDQHRRWYRATLMGPAFDLPFVENIGINAGPSGSLDKFGAVVVRQGRIVGRGWNQVTSTNDPTAHAEMVAIRAACRRLKTFQLDDCELYTSCEPCPMCLSAIYWARFKKVYYANTRKDARRIDFDDDLIYREVAAPISRPVTCCCAWRPVSRPASASRCRSNRDSWPPPAAAPASAPMRSRSGR